MRERQFHASIPGQILDQLRGMSKTSHYRVAYSGGGDSHVLLHLVAGLGDALGDATISAVHVNHGLQPNVDQWVHHVSRVCTDLEIACLTLVVDAHPGPGESPEAAARRARYGVMKGIMETNDILLTAHHLDDQAETLLLQMIRGAGPHGLAAMPRLVRFGLGWLGRPLLAISRDALRRYGQSQGLSWVEDPSNADDRFDRNYLRHEILPRLRNRWPGVAATLGRVAAHQARTAKRLDQLAKEDLAALQGSGRHTLSCRELHHLPLERRRNALHAWFRCLGLPTPNAAHIERILHDILDAGPDRMPLVRWRGVEVRRYRDDIHAMAPLPRWGPPVAPIIPWALAEPLLLSQGRLEARPVRGAGLRAASCSDDAVEIRFRQGGERCRTAEGHGHPLKKLFQEHGVPPWERDRMPLVFVAGELAAVVGFWVCHPFRTRAHEPGWVFDWTPGGPDGEGS
uniref:tRNA(Ile)-lysidine synthase n=1 Tax=Candidatus Kentrum sp. SD TaxID=2126332 RepID=A0A450Y5V6_9GAMM|nr:MAG: tRNA(Ile)-lysidine synthase [Candidatus Kentron sp. SD]VFK40569.1 MAG: tRNA(Ile)-lysidine synthase [Candidatus Kentron sp. SD]VFK78391.1 MAG: tRNA(Ile)-lysidine synthase [Candidatus Kentron sp. SD]